MTTETRPLDEIIVVNPNEESTEEFVERMEAMIEARIKLRVEILRD